MSTDANPTNGSTQALKVIAHIRSDFPAKFGLPRQSGLVDGIRAAVIFEPEYRDPDALRGIDGYTHLWLIWGFSMAHCDGWRPTVRPPRLGGNTSVGVFASRSPFRPNSLGLSSVRLCGVEHTEKHGDILIIAGSDMADGTPVYDVKPYLPFTDSHPDATGGFAEAVKDHSLSVVFPDGLLDMIPPDKREAIKGALSSDPRPAYQNDPDRIYGVLFSRFDVRFKVDGDTLTVCEVVIRDIE